MTVLVIDDDPVIRHAYSHYLEHKGYTVFQAENGRLGLDKLTHNAGITKVILDATMLEMDAFVFLQHVQADATFNDRHPDIYFVTSWDIDHVKKYLHRDNIDQRNVKEIFKKPIDLEMLLTMLQS